MAFARSESAPAPVQETFQTDKALVIAAGHLIHDIFTSFLSPLLPLIIHKLSLSLTLAGTLASFQQLPSLINPLVGLLADRGGLRWLVILAPTLTAIAMSMLGLAPNYVALSILVIAAGLSTALWHTPAPAMMARIAGRQVGQGMSLFMLGGSLAYAIGPLLAVAAVSWWGIEGIWRLVPLALGASALLYWRTRDLTLTRPGAKSDSAGRGSWRASLRGLGRLFVPITGILIAQGCMVVALTTFLPTFMSAEGASLWQAGGSLAVIESAGAVGVLASGVLSDRLGRRRILAVMSAAAPALTLAFLSARGWVMIPVLLAVGFAAFSSNPVIMALVQEYSRDRPATANGLYFMLNFVSRALLTIVVGALADRFGLRATFQACAWIGFAGLPFVLMLPRRNDG